MEQHDLRSVAVVGAGIMGRGIAQAFASADIAVQLCDQSLGLATRGRLAIQKGLSALADAGHVDADTIAQIVDRIRVSPDLGSATRGVSLVVEAVPEVMTLKKSVLADIADCASSDSIIATNTSSFDLDKLAEAVSMPQRFIGTHWYNPAYLVPCVELVRCSETSDETLEVTRRLLSQVGKEPVVVANSPGFIGNRLQFAMVAEAFRCVEEGIASPEDIDRVVRSSFGLRLADFGPMLLGDLGGLDTYYAILRYLTSELGNRFAPPAILERLVEEGRLGVKCGAGVFDYSDDEQETLLAERDLRLAQRVGGPPRSGTSARR